MKKHSRFLTSLSDCCCQQQPQNQHTAHWTARRLCVLQHKIYCLSVRSQHIHFLVFHTGRFGFLLILGGVVTTCPHPGGECISTGTVNLLLRISPFITKQWHRGMTSLFKLTVVRKEGRQDVWASSALDSALLTQIHCLTLAQQARNGALHPCDHKKDTA